MTREYVRILTPYIKSRRVHSFEMRTPACLARHHSGIFGAHPLLFLFCKRKSPATNGYRAFLSCWADSNCRPHPYYSPGRDTVVLPPAKTFEDVYGYMLVAQVGNYAIATPYINVLETIQKTMEYHKDDTAEY